MPTTFRRRSLAAVLAATSVAFAAPARADDVLVVAPAEFQPALAAWKAHRESQGLRVVVREPGTDVAAVVRSVHAQSAGKLRFVVLVGDVEKVPCAWVPVVAIAKWEKDSRIATDAPYADTDGDGVPDLAIGRVPADSADEARAMLARSVSAESSSPQGEWRRRVSVIAGTGGFGPLQDAALEQMTKQLLAKLVPPEFVVTATYGSPLSAWCPPPKEFSDTAVARINEGSLVLTYIGHGSANDLDRVQMGREKFPIFTAADVDRVAIRDGSPVAVLIACSTGSFDSARDCLAEELVRRPLGPAAVIASSRVSTPYSNAILSKEMLSALFAGRAATAGELLLAMKRRLVDTSAPDDERRTIESRAATFFDPDASRRAADRQEHLALYNLLGDPCFRIARPEALTVTAPASVVAGGTLAVTGTAPAAGRVLVELARRREAFVPIGSRKSAEEWRATYRAANSLVVASAASDVPAGPFRVEVTVPLDAKGEAGTIRVWFEGGGTAAAGGGTIDVIAAPRPSNPEAAPAGGR